MMAAGELANFDIISKNHLHDWSTAKNTGETMDQRLQRLVACGHKARTTCWSSSNTDP